MSNDDIVTKLLYDCLGLASSYLFGGEVALEPVVVGSRSPLADYPNRETISFVQQVKGRHAIACGMRLQEIVAEFESSISVKTSVSRSETLGGLKGLLDIPQFIQQRVRRVTPKRYPVIVTSTTPATPENTLMVVALRSLGRELGRTPFPKPTAEGRNSSKLYGWARGKLRRWPWNSVTKLDSVARLKAQVQQRNHKSQTANTKACLRLLDWFDEWVLDARSLGEEQRLGLAKGILAFPVDESFQHKLFEIWCLGEVVRSLERLGLVQNQPMRSLDLRGKGSLVEFSESNKRIQIWFQRQEPIGSGAWYYSDTKMALRGIPDIVLTSEGHGPLIIDAKFRKLYSRTSSEETYKMLGYAENFRDELVRERFTGVLIFLSDPAFSRRLVEPGGSELSLLSIDTALVSRKQFEATLDETIWRWMGGYSRT